MDSVRLYVLILAFVEVACVFYTAAKAEADPEEIAVALAFLFAVQAPIFGRVFGWW